MRVTHLFSPTLFILALRFEGQFSGFEGQFSGLRVGILALRFEGRYTGSQV